MAVAQASQDLGVHGTVLRSWVKAFAGDPQHSFPGHGQLKPEQAEIARLKREVTKLKAERDILKKAAAYFAKEIDVKFSFVAKHRVIWPAGWLCEALGVSRGGFYAWLDATAQRACQKQRRAWSKGTRKLPGQRPDLRRTARVARHAGGRCVVQSSQDRTADAPAGFESRPR